MGDVEITELDELQASKVSGVATAANGTPFLVLKAAAAVDDDTEDPLAENRKRMKEGKPLVKKSDEFDETGTGEAVASKALSAADRKTMPASSFAFVDKNGGKHLPIHDEGHTKAAISRFGSQDFSEAKGKPADAKEAAARKITSAAKKHGVEISDSSNVAEAAKKGAVQDALDGTKTPVEGGHLDTGHSSAAGSVTAGVKPVASTIPAGETATSQSGVTGAYQGGEATVVIPAEAKLMKVVAIASLVDAISALDDQRQAVKDGKYLQVDNPLLNANVDPGSAPWESYDSATLSQVAQCLAGCCNAIDSIRQREAVEVASGSANEDSSNVWDLVEAKHALDYAMGVAARLAFSEAAETGADLDVTKDLNVEQLIDVRQTLDDAIGVVKDNRASDAGSDSEETITMELTKSEFVASVQEILKADRKAEKKARKAAQREADEAEAVKNANNGGDISEADIKPTKETDADDVNAVKGEGDEPEPAIKAVNDQLETLTKSLADVTELVTKIAKRPRAGGPSLDGQARGVSPAAEGRQGDVTKSAEDNDIETLEKSLADEKDPLMKDELGRKLTYARLVRLHESGRL